MEERGRGKGEEEEMDVITLYIAMIICLNLLR